MAGGPAPGRTEADARGGSETTGLATGHHLVATLAADHLAALVAALQDIPRGEEDGVGPSLAEVRLDALWPTTPDTDTATDHLLSLTEDAPVPLLATLRPRRQGGAFDGPEETRIGLLVAAAKAGFAAIDVENDNQDMRALLRALRPDAPHVVLSDHRFPEPPSRVEGMRHLLAMQDLGSDVQKIAFPCGSFADALRALELAAGHRARNGRPCVMPVGGGAPLRALLAIAGNRATYGHAPGLAPAVPGQPDAAAIASVWRHWGLAPDDLDTAGEGWYAVIGAPVHHSLSPQIHNGALRAAGRPQRYGALEVPPSPGALRLLLTVADRIGLRGLSITAPHKVQAADILRADQADRLDPAATATGATNCIRIDDARGPVGTNTDATALRRILADHVAQGARLAVLGAGGAARAALWAGTELGLQCSFTSRDPERARAVQTALGAQWVPWEERHHLRPEAWVQATPIGHPEDPVPLRAEQLKDASLLVELVYADGPTPLQTLTPSSVHVVGGRSFLLEQAVDAFRFWTGASPDRAAMAAALTGIRGVRGEEGPDASDPPPMATPPHDRGGKRGDAP